MSHRQQIYDKEKESFNLVIFKKFGKTFELVVDPDLTISYRNKKNKNLEDLSELVRAEKIFSDAKKGEIASPQDIKEVFSTENFFEIAQKMISEGEIQITAEHREKLRQEKRNKIVNLIHRSAINPKTKTPHPVTRIENAMAEAKVKIDEFKKAEDQVQDVLSKLKPIIPISFDTITLSIRLPMKYASKLHTNLQGFGKIENEMWSGELFMCKIQIPAGMQEEVMNEINGKTHGTADIEIEKK